MHSSRKISAETLPFGWTLRRNDLDWMNIRLDEGNRLVVSKASRNQVLIEGIHLKNVVVSK